MIETVQARAWSAVWSGIACAALLLPTFGAVAPVCAQEGSPAGPVPVDLLSDRRAALLDRLGSGVAILRSAGLRDIERDYPQDSDFRQKNDFFYLTGLETADSWLVLIGRSDGPGRAILYLPPRNPDAERWTGPKLGPGEEAARLTGIRDVRSSEKVKGDLRSMLTPAPSAGPGVAVYVSASQAPEAVDGLRDAIGGDAVRVQDLRPHMAALRLVKDADEVDRLRRAIEITGEAHRVAMHSARPGMWEYELEALIEYTFRRRGAERVGFPSIVGSGPNATVLHYDKSRRRLEAGDLVVIDIGAEFGYYSADVTRTIPVSGRFTDRQRALYDLVLGAQQAALDAVRPGTTLAALTAIVRRHLRDNSGDLCAPVTCDRFFVHGLSHWLGMDVHDVGDYATPLAPGMVFTIEPGVYLPEQAIGIRIEDDVLVTATGHELLSGAAPRAADEIERLMSEGARERASRRLETGAADLAARGLRHRR